MTKNTGLAPDERTSAEFEASNPRISFPPHENPHHRHSPCPSATGSPRSGNRGTQTELEKSMIDCNGLAHSRGRPEPVHHNTAGLDKIYLYSVRSYLI